MEIYYCPQQKRKTQFQTFLLYTYCRNTYPKVREHHENVQSCPSNEERELSNLNSDAYTGNHGGA